MIVGVGYQALRSWMKRGALGHKPRPPSEGWEWADFDTNDLNTLRLMKVLLDAGFPWELVCEITGSGVLMLNFIVIYDLGKKWETLVKIEPSYWNFDHFTVVNLVRIRRQVLAELRK